jgi:hypothetical protein
MKTSLILSSLLLASGMAQAAILTTVTHLSGAGENPPNASPATGDAVVTYDSATHMMRVTVTFSGLLGNTTASHIHASAVPPGNAGVATQVPTFTGFPLGVKSGSYDHTFDLTQASSYNPAFITANGGTVAAAEAALTTALANGTAYLNIHTSVFGGGEIRGFLLLDSDADGVPDRDDAFPHSRDVGGDITIAGCDTGVANVVFEDGSTISDLIYEIAGGARNHGGFVSGVAKLNQALINETVVTGDEAQAIQSCAGRAKLP